MPKPSIVLDNVSLEYPVFQMRSKSIKMSVLKQIVGSRIDRSNGNVNVKALNNVNIDIKSGDRIGLIGLNGSGKSTLLRLLAGVMDPHSGRARIEGRVVSLIEKGLGINPELSGRNNIELPLRLLGATNEEVNQAIEEIPEWTELGEFIDLPVRIYSEGMKARLSFAISTALVGDILLLDEWMGAGDMKFVARANERLESVLNGSGIVVMASHSGEIIKRFCNKVIWMEKGNVREIGETEKVLTNYHLEHFADSQ